MTPRIHCARCRNVPPNGLALVEHRASGHDAALGLRVAQWKPGKPTTLGKVAVENGVLALLLPYATGKLTPKQLATKKPLSLEDRFLAPLPNGTYEVTQHDFSPERGYEDELGSYGSIVRIVHTKKRT